MIQTSDTQTRAAAFDTVAEADQAIRRLRAAGFSEDQLAVICPAKFKDHFRPEAPRSETPAAGAGEAVATGGAIGATLGGLVLVATVITGGVGGLAAAGVLIGGGAIAGGFSNLIAAKGYEHEADDSYQRAVERGQIVVGVEVRNEDGANQLAEAQRILEAAGGSETTP